MTSSVSDPLGLACDGTCPGGYKCWADTGKPPGMCVPACSAAAPACPAHFTCSTEQQVCLRSAPSGDASDSGGCAVAAPGKQRSGVAWLGAAALAMLAGTRRLKRRGGSGT
jgi:MYXO-CTERM domain-containing protein